MSTMSGTVASLNVSPGRGTKKKPVQEAVLTTAKGIEGDGHSGIDHKQVSFLADESAQKMRDAGAEVGFGDFAENITTRGIDLLAFKVGDRFTIGEEILLEVSQIGKECHHGCEIARLVGKCVMPEEGIFAIVLRGGTIRVGDPIDPVRKEA